ncbi:MAG: ABC transporter substrate-binding protein [Treponema sp.]|jgi:multiple sugar transport system substrate-binding protein|nr:ABC transporter substrate-binding protein [Treponema sp.]
MKKTILVLLCVLVLLAPVFAGGSKDKAPASAGKQTLVFWNVFTGSDGEILREICERFNKTNAQGITIQVDIMPNDQLQQKLPAAIATNTAPDMVLFGIEYLAPYVNSGSLEDISDFWPVMGVDKANYLDSVVKLSQVDGKLYGVPMQYNVQYLYWNKDLFRAAGLNPDKAPATLAELSEYAVKLTNPSKNQFGLALPVGVSYPHLLWANGGDINDPARSVNLLSSPENLATLKWLQDLTVNKKVTPINVTGPEADMMLQNGQVAMYMSGPWQINGLRNQGVNFGVGSVPAGSSGSFSPAGGCSYMIPKGTSAEKKAAVYAFMKYWLSDDILKEWSLRNGFPVWSKSLQTRSDIQNDKVLFDISKATEIGRSYNLGYALASQIDRDAIVPMFDSVIDGSVSPESALKTASDKLDTILK